jgi:HD superfamily phosphohydrolase
MRDLHQLGSSYFVFPTANHSRFEHSLGTGHLCREYIRKLKMHSHGEVTESIEKSVIIAGLCHNIGHGPYAYPFTDFVHEVLQDKSWESAQSSIMLLEDIISSNSIDLSQEEINLIKDMIVGENKFSEARKDSYPHWSLQILHNKTNGVDIDKFDFIRRDTYKLGLRNESFDGDILLNHARILENQICFREKDAFSIYELFNTRYRLFKEFYLHRVSKGVDLMIKDIFTEANSYFDFKSYLYDPEQFIKLKDSILNQILYSDKPELTNAKEIVKRIYKRDLYKFVGEKTCVESSTQLYEKFLNLSEEDILNCASSTDYKEEQLLPGDIKIMKCQLDFGKGEDDPIECVKFYSKDKQNGKLTVKNLKRDQISLLTPSNFKEYIFRVYVKDPNKLNSAKNAFFKFCSEKTGETPNQYEKKSANKLDRFDR